jgi:peptidoglycan/LPS O-acetylase OafA/YrhL
VFFLACRAGLKRSIQCLFIALLGGLLLPLDEHIARGAIGFFMGGFAFFLWQTWKNDVRAARIARISGWIALAGWAFICLLTYIRVEWFFKGESNFVFIVPFDFLLCPLTVFALAMREYLRGPSHTIFGFLGDISYAVYLLHFPMLILLALLSIHFDLGIAFLMQGWVMLTFLVVLIGLSTLVYYCFERPLQQMIRGRLAPAETRKDRHHWIEDRSTATLGR